MSTLKFEYEAVLLKDWVCMQYFQQDALEFEIIAFFKAEMTSYPKWSSYHLNAIIFV